MIDHQAPVQTIRGGIPSQADPPPPKSIDPLTTVPAYISFLVLSSLLVVSVILAFSCTRHVTKVSTPEPERAQVVQIFPDEEDPPALVQKCEGIEAGMLYFGFDRSEVDSVGVKAVEGLAERLRGCEGEIRVIGNCDERGSREYNQGLGVRRAIEVRKELVGRGIEWNRIICKSYGEDSLAVEGCVDEGCHEKNRRVEIVVVK